MASYEYDPYGKVISATGWLADINPIRYRGYYYDLETGLYHLWSRYYDPQTGRFLSPDSYASTGQGVLGYNMFAYCHNNPANYFDPSGNAAVMTCHADADMFLWGGLSYLGFSSGGGGGGGRGGSITTAVMNSDTASNKDITPVPKPDSVFLYKGALVIITDLPVDRAAASFGIIVIDNYYTGEPEKFKDTLNHEYGHFVHFNMVGSATYSATTALPSFIGAGLANVSRPVYDIYDSLPWERTADFLGGVNGDYDWGADTFGSLFWIWTLTIGLGAG